MARLLRDHEARVNAAIVSALGHAALFGGTPDFLVKDGVEYWRDGRVVLPAPEDDEP